MVLGFVWKVVVLIDIIPGFKLFNDLLWRLYLLSLTFLHNFLKFKVWQKYILWSWRNNSKLKRNTSKPILRQIFCIINLKWHYLDSNFGVQSFDFHNLKCISPESHPSDIWSHLEQPKSLHSSPEVSY